MHSLTLKWVIRQTTTSGLYLYFARNLADTEYRRYAFDTLAYFGADENIPGNPRWVGGNVTYNW